MNQSNSLNKNLNKRYQKETLFIGDYDGDEYKIKRTKLPVASVYYTHKFIGCIIEKLNDFDSLAKKHKKDKVYRLELSKYNWVPDSQHNENKFIFILIENYPKSANKNL